jgi:protein Xni
MRVLLVDGLNLVRRLYEARPHDGSATVAGEVVSSSSKSLLRALHRHQPSHVCCVFDSRGRTWRHELYPDYKANRKPTPEPLRESLPEFEQAFHQLGVPCVTIPGYEADDVIATLAVKISNSGGQVTILSTDKGYLQLLGERVSVYDHFSERALTPAMVLDKYRLRHDQLVDFWALAGDPSANIKGVPHIGPRTAQQLLAAAGTLDALLAEPPEGTVGQRLKTHGEALAAYRELLRLRLNVSIGINLNQLRYLD